MSEFKTNDFVVLLKEGTKDYLLKIVEHKYTDDLYRVKILKTGQYGPVFKDEIRLAKKEEIAAGHRILTINEDKCREVFESIFGSGPTLINGMYSDWKKAAQFSEFKSTWDLCQKESTTEILELQQKLQVLISNWRGLKIKGIGPEHRAFEEALNSCANDLEQALQGGLNG
ncbi:hypothetical protein [Acinetobacter baumannii]|uniref:hypothetical protein n=1 Tax=Acinetobacter baumannii TaxID=470 RepID=UPI0025430C87|nr:hypothetical protein [Acinetobacter baumannii]WIH75501.1 hypothetical protein M2A29_05620 [Acinetobacter baumannii]